MEEKDLQEIQILEQNLQNIVYQKQTFQIEFSEINSALKEIQFSGEEVYKIAGQIMIKTEKSNIIKELESKKKIINLRLKSIDEQEKSIINKLEKIKRKIN
jgi:prefoldin beta subunit